MAVNFQPKRMFASQNVDASPGHFAMDETPLKWENCRERFAKVFTEQTTGFYFKHHGASADVAAFILKTENILKEDEQSKFAETNRPSIVWLEPSAFWKACQMRRSLLTVLLRCGMMYECDRDNYEEALFSQEYIVPTKKAVMRFLFGFTKYTGPDISTGGSVQFRGWKSIFEGKAESEVKSMLVWPNETVYCPKVDLASSLWV